MATKATPQKSTSKSNAAAPPVALAKTDPNQKLAVQSAEDLLEQAAGVGTENIGVKDMAIPRVSMLQSLSPQCQKAEGQFIKGAEPGDFFDSVASSILAKGEDGILFVPVSYRLAHIEWIPKKKGGGFIADHGESEAILLQCTKNEDGAMMLPNGHEVVKTMEYYCFVLNLDGTNPRQYVISFAKTQLKKAKKMNTIFTSLRFASKKNPGRTYIPPIFASVFLAKAVPESNQKGSWMGWEITRHGNTAELKECNDLLQAAQVFHEAVSSGAVKVAQPDDAAAIDAGAPEDGATL